MKLKYILLSFLISFGMVSCKVNYYQVYEVKSSDLLQKDKKSSKDFAKYNPLNLGNNFDLKRKNSTSIFEHNNNRKNGIFINDNYYNIIDNIKKKYDNGFKESFVDTNEFNIMNYQNSQNNDEDSIDINNIDNSSILIDNIK